MVPAASISQAIRQAATFTGGQAWPILCDAIGQAIVAWAPTPGNVVIQGVSTGVVGSGTVTGVFQIFGPPVLVPNAMTAGGLTGTTVAPIGTAIGLGLIQSLSGSLQYQGTSVGVAQGTDVSMVVSTNVPTLTAALQAAHAGILSAQGGSGAVLPAFYTSIAAGIAAMLDTAVTLPAAGVVTPAGPLGPGSSTGTTVSFVV